MNDFKDFGIDVAKVLGLDYFCDTAIQVNDNSAVIRKRNTDVSYQIFLTQEERKKKIYIRGNYPVANDKTEFPRQAEQAEGIAVSLTRPAHAVAKEIATRFLPAYNEAFRKGIEARNARNDYIRRQQEMAHHFASLVDGKVTESGDRVSPASRVRSNRGYLHDDIYINVSDNTVNMHFRGIPADIAEKMLALYMGDYYGVCIDRDGELNQEGFCSNRHCHYHTNPQPDKV